MLTKMLMRKSATVAQGLTFVTSAISTGSTIVIPSDAAIGDLAILFDHAENDHFYPDLVTPTGWTAINNVNAYVSIRKAALSRKKLVSGDPGATITGMNGNLVNRKVIAVFRPNNAIGTVTTYDSNTEGTWTAPASQVLETQTAPYVAIGATWCDSIPAWTAWNDGTVDNDYYTRLAYKVYNSSPANVTVALAEYGEDNILASCIVKVT